MSSQLTSALRWAVTGLSLSMLMPSLDVSIANVGLPALAQAFGAVFQQAQWIVLAYLLVITTLIVGAGRLGDIVGHRRLLLFGIGVFTGASLLCGLAPTLWILIAARAAQGFGAAVMMALTMALAAEIVPKAKTGAVMGLLGTMSAVGTTLGPSLGGILIAGFGWRSIFVVNVPLGILNFILAQRYLSGGRPESKSRGARFDVIGTVLLALTLGSYALAMTIGRATFGTLNTGLLVAAVVGAMLFLFAESKAASPLLHLAMFRDRMLNASLTTSVLVSTVLMATLVVGPFYLSRSLGLSEAVVGLVVSIGPLVAALTGVPAGHIVDRFGSRRITIISLTGIASGVFALSLLPLTFGVVGYIASIIVVTANYALFQASNNTAVLRGVGADRRGLVSGMLNLSRNLGLVTGASAMGSVFASFGMPLTFAFAGVLMVIALATAVMNRPKLYASAAAMIAMLACPILANAQTPPSKVKDSRGKATLTLSAQARLRYDSYDNAQLVGGKRYSQGLFRGIFGADLRLNPHVRVYGEIGTGQVDGRRREAAANFQNDASLQQLFADAWGSVGATLVGATVGRQEFSDGPRQLVSVGDGANLHRTWNGVRFYAQGRDVRVGVFDLRATQLGRGFFDETVNNAERLQGVNAGIIVSRGKKAATNISLDPFWMHTKNATFRSGGVRGLDDRLTRGARLWGKRGNVSIDWTIARQTGKFMNRDIDATGVFAIQDLLLSNKGWRPHLTARVDVASGGGVYDTGTLKDFNQLYASSSYLSEAQFLSLSNLMMLSPGISLSPTSRTAFSTEYGFARRLNENDAAYAGGMRPYAGTQNVRGRAIGGLLRFVGKYSAGEHLAVFVDYEQLNAGDVLTRAKWHSGRYGYVGATFRY